MADEALVIQIKQAIDRISTYSHEDWQLAIKDALLAHNAILKYKNSEEGIKKGKEGEATLFGEIIPSNEEGVADFELVFKESERLKTSFFEYVRKVLTKLDDVKVIESLFSHIKNNDKNTLYFIEKSFKLDSVAILHATLNQNLELGIEGGVSEEFVINSINSALESRAYDCINAMLKREDFIANINLAGLMRTAVKEKKPELLQIIYTQDDRFFKQFDLLSLVNFAIECHQYQFLKHLVDISDLFEPDFDFSVLISHAYKTHDNALLNDILHLIEGRIEKGPDAVNHMLDVLLGSEKEGINLFLPIFFKKLSTINNDNNDVIAKHLIEKAQKGLWGSLGNIIVCCNGAGLVISEDTKEKIYQLALKANRFDVTQLLLDKDSSPRARYLVIVNQLEEPNQTDALLMDAFLQRGMSLRADFSAIYPGDENPLSEMFLEIEAEIQKNYSLLRKRAIPFQSAQENVNKIIGDKREEAFKLFIEENNEHSEAYKHALKVFVSVSQVFLRSPHQEKIEAIILKQNNKQASIEKVEPVDQTPKPMSLTEQVIGKLSSPGRYGDVEKIVNNPLFGLNEDGSENQDVAVVLDYLKDKSNEAYSAFIDACQDRAHHDPVFAAHSLLKRGLEDYLIRKITLLAQKADVDDPKDFPIRDEAIKEIEALLEKCESRAARSDRLRQKILSELVPLRNKEDKYLLDSPDVIGWLVRLSAKHHLIKYADDDTEKQHPLPLDLECFYEIDASQNIQANFFRAIIESEVFLPGLRDIIVPATFNDHSIEKFILVCNQLQLSDNEKDLLAEKIMQKAKAGQWWLVGKIFIQANLQGAVDADAKAKLVTLAKKAERNDVVQILNDSSHSPRARLLDTANLEGFSDEVKASITLADSVLQDAMLLRAQYVKSKGRLSYISKHRKGEFDKLERFIQALYQQLANGEISPYEAIFKVAARVRSQEGIAKIKKGSTHFVRVANNFLEKLQGGRKKAKLDMCSQYQEAFLNIQRRKALKAQPAKTIIRAFEMSRYEVAKEMINDPLFDHEDDIKAVLNCIKNARNDYDVFIRACVERAEYDQEFANQPLLKERIIRQQEDDLIDLIVATAQKAYSKDEEDAKERTEAISELNKLLHDYDYVIRDSKRFGPKLVATVLATRDENDPSAFIFEPSSYPVFSREAGVLQVSKAPGGDFPNIILKVLNLSKYHTLNLSATLNSSPALQKMYFQASKKMAYVLDEKYRDTHSNAINKSLDINNADTFSSLCELLGLNAKEKRTVSERMMLKAQEGQWDFLSNIFIKNDWHAIIDNRTKVMLIGLAKKAERFDVVEILTNKERSPRAQFINQSAALSDELSACASSIDAVLQQVIDLALKFKTKAIINDRDAIKYAPSFNRIVQALSKLGVSAQNSYQCLAKGEASPDDVFTELYSNISDLYNKEAANNNALKRILETFLNQCNEPAGVKAKSLLEKFADDFVASQKAIISSVKEEAAAAAEQEESQAELVITALEAGRLDQVKELINSPMLNSNKELDTITKAISDKPKLFRVFARFCEDRANEDAQFAELPVMQDLYSRLDSNALIQSMINAASLIYTPNDIYELKEIARDDEKLETRKAGITALKTLLAMSKYKIIHDEDFRNELIDTILTTIAEQDESRSLYKRSDHLFEPSLWIMRTNYKGLDKRKALTSQYPNALDYIFTIMRDNNITHTGCTDIQILETSPLLQTCYLKAMAKAKLPFIKPNFRRSIISGILKQGNVDSFEVLSNYIDFNEEEKALIGKKLLKMASANEWSLLGEILIRCRLQDALNWEMEEELTQVAKDAGRSDVIEMLDYQAFCSRGVKVLRYKEIPPRVQFLNSLREADLSSDNLANARTMDVLIQELMSIRARYLEEKGGSISKHRSGKIKEAENFGQDLYIRLATGKIAPIAGYRELKVFIELLKDEAPFKLDLNKRIRGHRPAPGVFKSIAMDFIRNNCSGSIDHMIKIGDSESYISAQKNRIAKADAAAAQKLAAQDDASANIKKQVDRVAWSVEEQNTTESDITALLGATSAKQLQYITSSPTPATPSEIGIKSMLEDAYDKILEEALSQKNTELAVAVIDKLGIDVTRMRIIQDSMYTHGQNKAWDYLESLLHNPTLSKVVGGSFKDELYQLGKAANCAAIFVHLEKVRRGNFIDQLPRETFLHRMNTLDDGYKRAAEEVDAFCQAALGIERTYRAGVERDKASQSLFDSFKNFFSSEKEIDGWFSLLGNMVRDLYRTAIDGGEFYKKFKKLQVFIHDHPPKQLSNLTHEVVGKYFFGRAARTHNLRDELRELERSRRKAAKSPLSTLKENKAETVEQEQALIKKEVNEQIVSHDQDEEAENAKPSVKDQDMLEISAAEYPKVESIECEEQSAKEQRQQRVLVKNEEQDESRSEKNARASEENKVLQQRQPSQQNRRRVRKWDGDALPKVRESTVDNEHSDKKRAKKQRKGRKVIDKTSNNARADKRSRNEEQVVLVRKSR